MRTVPNEQQFVDEVTSGDRRRALEALRDKCAAALGEPLIAPRDVAALTTRLQSVLAELDEQPSEPKGTPVDELGKRRRDRLAGADVQPRPAVRGKRRK